MRLSAHLDELGGEPPRGADPVDGGEEAVPGHAAEDERAQLLPLLAEVEGVDLSEEHGQDHGQDRHQVHLPPVLGGNVKLKQTSQRPIFKIKHLFKSGSKQSSSLVFQ